MKYKSYNNELKIATAQILDVFNNIEIYRFNSDSEISDTIEIPIVYGHRSSILKSLENRNKTIKFPIMALSISGVGVNINRIHSLNNDIMYKDEVNSKILPKYKIGMPVKIGYNITLLTKYQDDLDQWISNITMNLMPSIYVVWPHPYNKGNIKSKISWDGEFDIEYPTEFENTTYKLEATISLEYNTWLFGGMANYDYGTGEGNGATDPTEYIINHINLSTTDNYDYLGGFQYTADVETVD